MASTEEKISILFDPQGENDVIASMDNIEQAVGRLDSTFQDMLAKATSEFKTLTSGIKTVGGEVKTLGGVFKTVVENTIKDAIKGVTNGFTKLKEAIRSVVDAAKSKMAALKDHIHTVYQELKTVEGATKIAAKAFKVFVRSAKGSLNTLIQSLKAVAKKSFEVGKSVAKLGPGIVGGLAIAGAGAVAMLGNIGDAANTARGAFDELGGSDAELARLAESTHGNLTTDELVQYGAKLRQLGLDFNQTNSVMETALGAAASSGKEFSEVVEAIGKGVSEGNTDVLREWGVQAQDSGKVLEAAAKKAGKSVDELTAAEKRNAAAAALSAGNSKQLAIAKQAEGDVIAKTGVAFKNLQQEIQRSIADELSKSGVLEPILESVKEITKLVAPIVKALTPIVGVAATLVESLMPVVDAITSLLVPIGEVVEALIVGLQPAFEALGALAGPLSEVIQTLAPLFKTIGNVVGQSLKVVFEALGQVIEQNMPTIEALVGAFTELLPVVSDIIKAVVPLVPVLGELAMVAANLLVPALKIVAPVLRTAAQGVGLLLKPLGKAVEYIVKAVNAVLTLGGRSKRTVDVASKAVKAYRAETKKASKETIKWSKSAKGASESQKDMASSTNEAEDSIKSYLKTAKDAQKELDGIKEQYKHFEFPQAIAAKKNLQALESAAGGVLGNLKKVGAEKTALALLKNIEAAAGGDEAKFDALLAKAREGLVGEKGSLQDIIRLQSLMREYRIARDIQDEAELKRVRAKVMEYTALGVKAKDLTDLMASRAGDSSLMADAQKVITKNLGIQSQIAGSFKSLDRLFYSDRDSFTPQELAMALDAKKDSFKKQNSLDQKHSDERKAATKAAYEARKSLLKDLEKNLAQAYMSDYEKQLDDIERDTQVKLATFSKKDVKNRAKVLEWQQIQVAKINRDLLSESISEMGENIATYGSKLKESYQAQQEIITEARLAGMSESQRAIAEAEAEYAETTKALGPKTLFNAAAYKAAGELRQRAIKEATADQIKASNDIIEQASMLGMSSLQKRIKEINKQYDEMAAGIDPNLENSAQAFEAVKQLRKAAIEKAREEVKADGPMVMDIGVRFTLDPDMVSLAESFRTAKESFKMELDDEQFKAWTASSEGWQIAATSLGGLNDAFVAALPAVDEYKQAQDATNQAQADLAAGRISEAEASDIQSEATTKQTKAVVAGAAGAVAAGGKAAKALVKSARAKAAVEAIIEGAYALKAAAIGDYIGAGLHTLAAIQFGILAGTKPPKAKSKEDRDMSQLQGVKRTQVSSQNSTTVVNQNFYSALDQRPAGQIIADALNQSAQRNSGVALSSSLINDSVSAGL